MNDGVWENSYRDTHTYDSNGYLITSLSTEWIDDGWKETYKITYTNDPIGNVIIWEFYTWDEDSDNWGQSQTEPYQMSINGNEYWTNPGKKIQIHWFLSEATEINPFSETIEISLYPNPASSDLSVIGIEYQCVATIYSLDGKQVQTNKFSTSNKVLNTSQLKSGIYILKIETIKGIVMKKFVKQ